jgi:hypothetical protein
VATIRVLRTAKATLSRTFYLDEVGTPATGAVSVSVTRLDGTIVQSVSATGPDAGNAYSFTFQGSDVLDELVLTWSATIGGDAVVLDSDVIEVAGGFYFGLAEARAIDSALANVTKYPTALLVDARVATEDECELITGQAWVPRFCRETLSGDGSGRLRASHTMIRAVRAITVNGSAWSGAAALGFSDTGMIYSDSGSFAPSRMQGSRNVVVEYEHGHDRPRPDILRGAKIRFKSIALSGKSALPDRAERLVTVDAGTVFLASPAVDKVGIPEVDAAYARAPSPRPGFG